MGADSSLLHRGQKDGPASVVVWLDDVVPLIGRGARSFGELVGADHAGVTLLVVVEGLVSNFVSMSDSHTGVGGSEVCSGVSRGRWWLLWC